MDLDYYPFGLTFNSFSRENSLANQYKYNGKEEQDELNLRWLDYGARMYQADIGRWGVIDPLTENFMSWSPYTYVMDNPANFIDEEGLMPGDPKYSGSGNVVIIIADSPDDPWNTSTLDKTDWDYGVFGNLSEANRWIQSTYGKDNIGIDNLSNPNSWI